MVTDCAPFVADLFLIFYVLSDNKQAGVIEAFNSTIYVDIYFYNPYSKQMES